MAMQDIRVRINNQQRKALLEHANKTGNSVSEEIQAAIDFYLNDISIEDWQELNRQSLSAQQELMEMEKKLDSLNHNLATAFREIEKIRKVR